MRPLAMIVAAALFPVSAYAGTLTVGAGQQYPGLQAAVTAANAGDTILVVPGTLAVGAVVSVGKSLTIRGSGGTPVLTAAGNEILRVTAGTVTVQGIKFMPSGGRAVRVSGGVVTLDTIEITGNNNANNTLGAALQVDGPANLTIRSSSIHDNTARGGTFLTPTYGGCLYLNGGDVTIESTTVSGCKGEYGGAIALLAGTLTVQGSTFTSNVAGSGYEGGAIFTELGTTTEIRDSVFRNNSSLGNGGALELDGQTVVTGSTFDGNQAEIGSLLATGSGGAIYAYCDVSCPSLTIEDNDFHGNTATGQGGAVYFATPGAVRFVRNLVCSNVATSEGGGVTISARARSWLLLDNVFESNAGYDGAAVQCNTATDGTGAAASGGKILNNDFLANVPGSSLATVALGSCSAAVKNNLFARNQQYAFSGGTGGFDYNLWFSNGADTSGRTRGAHDQLAADPRLTGWVNDGDCSNDSFDLGVGSPAINTGDPAILDLDGSRSDIGATGGPDAPQTSDDDGDGYTQGRDCDDTNPQIHPGVPEVCDGVDQDCDGVIDGPAPASAATWFYDGDGDGHGLASSAIQACDQPPGYASVGDDCKDNNAAVFPGSPEFCDGIDNDCDDLIDGADVGDLPRWYPDRDGDGYGRPGGNPTEGCEAPPGTVANDDDCDDGNANVAPLAPEHCDGVDEDCDGKVDNQPVSGITFWKDEDGDGWGDPDGRTVEACHPSNGFVNRAGDCDDLDRDVHPLAVEPCDPGRDLNCDGAFGQDDNDSDGFPACEDCDDYNSEAYPGAGDDWYDGIITNCDHLSDYDRDEDGVDAFEGGGKDCNDKNNDIFPGATDVPNDDIDQDCDGEDADVSVVIEDTDASDTDSSDEPGKLACHGCDAGEGLTAWPALWVLAALRRRRR